MAYSLVSKYRTPSPDKHVHDDMALTTLKFKALCYFLVNKEHISETKSYSDHSTK